MVLNAEVFSWPERLPALLDGHRLIIRSSREKGEDLLRKRREAFVEKLNRYKKVLAGYKNNGKVENVEEYLVKAQEMQGNLDEANVTIEAFNKEEEAFGWDPSQYKVCSPC